MSVPGRRLDQPSSYVPPGAGSDWQAAFVRENLGGAGNQPIVLDNIIPERAGIEDILSIMPLPERRQTLLRYAQMLTGTVPVPEGLNLSDISRLMRALINQDEWRPLTTQALRQAIETTIQESNGVYPPSALRALQTLVFAASRGDDAESYRLLVRVAGMPSPEGPVRAAPGRPAVQPPPEFIIYDWSAARYCASALAFDAEHFPSNRRRLLHECMRGLLLNGDRSNGGELNRLIERLDTRETRGQLRTHLRTQALGGDNDALMLLAFLAGGGRGQDHEAAGMLADIARQNPAQRERVLQAVINCCNHTRRIGDALPLISAVLSGSNTIPASLDAAGQRRVVEAIEQAAARPDTRALHLLIHASGDSQVDQSVSRTASQALERLAATGPDWRRWVIGSIINQHQGDRAANIPVNVFTTLVRIAGEVAPGTAMSLPDAVQRLQSRAQSGTNRAAEILAMCASGAGRSQPATDRACAALEGLCTTASNRGSTLAIILQVYRRHGDCFRLLETAGRIAQQMSSVPPEVSQALLSALRAGSTAEALSSRPVSPTTDNPSHDAERTSCARGFLALFTRTNTWNASVINEIARNPSPEMAQVLRQIIDQIPPAAGRQLVTACLERLQTERMGVRSAAYGAMLAALERHLQPSDITVLTQSAAYRTPHGSWAIGNALLSLYENSPRLRNTVLTALFRDGFHEGLGPRVSALPGVALANLAWVEQAQRLIQDNRIRPDSHAIDIPQPGGGTRRGTMGELRTAYAQALESMILNPASLNVNGIQAEMQTILERRRLAPTVTVEQLNQRIGQLCEQLGLNASNIVFPAGADTARDRAPQLARLRDLLEIQSLVRTLACHATAQDEIDRQVRVALAERGLDANMTLEQVGQGVTRLCAQLGLNPANPNLEADVREQAQTQARLAELQDLVQLRGLRRLIIVPSMALRNSIQFLEDSGRAGDAYALAQTALTDRRFEPVRAIQAQLPADVRFAEVAEQSTARIWQTQATRAQELLTALVAVEQARQNVPPGASDGERERLERERIAALRRILTQAGQIDPSFVRAYIAELAQARTEAAALPDGERAERLRQIDEQIGFWRRVQTARVRAEYRLAEELTSLGSRLSARGNTAGSAPLFQEATGLLISVSVLDPEHARTDAGFQRMMRLALSGGRATEAFEHPLVTIEREARLMERGARPQSLAIFQDALARAERFCNPQYANALAAHLDRQIQVLQQQLQNERDNVQRHILQDRIAAMQAYAERARHEASAVPMARYMVALCHIARRQGDEGIAMLDSIQRDFPEFARNPRLRMAEVRRAANDNTSWARFRRGAAEILSSAGAAIVGLGVGTLTSPFITPVGGTAAGVAAGGATRYYLRSWIAGDARRPEDFLIGGLDVLGAGAAGRVRGVIMGTSSAAAGSTALRAGFMRTLFANAAAGGTNAFVHAGADGVIRIFQGQDLASVARHVGGQTAWGAGFGILAFGLPDRAGRLAGNLGPAGLRPALTSAGQGVGASHLPQLLYALPLQAGLAGYEAIEEYFNNGLRLDHPADLRRYQETWASFNAPLRPQDVIPPARLNRP